MDTRELTCFSQIHKTGTSPRPYAAVSSFCLVYLAGMSKEKEKCSTSLGKSSLTPSLCTGVQTLKHPSFPFHPFIPLSRRAKKLQYRKPHQEDYSNFFFSRYQLNPPSLHFKGSIVIKLFESFYWAFLKPLFTSFCFNIFLNKIFTRG